MNTLSSIHHNVSLSSKILISDGSSLSGWTLLNGTGLAIKTTFGNPAPSIYPTSSNSYGYINLATIIPGLTTFKGHTLQFDVFAPYSSIPDIFFACDASGAGQMFRIDQRAGPPVSGLAKTTSWTLWGNPSGIPLSSSTWYTIVITISTAGVATWTYNGTPSGLSFTLNKDGTYIGIQYDGGNTNGYVDNIYFW